MGILSFRALRAAAASLAVLLVASTATAPAQSPALTTIRFTSSASDDLRPLLYAQSAGLFQKAGLNVVIDKAASGGVVAQSVIGGAMDIGKASLVSLIAAYARGVPFALIAPSAIHRKDDNNSGIMIAANSPLKSVLDLQGKVVGCTAIGDIGYLGIRGLIDAQGGDSSTVKWVEIPISTLGPAIEAGRVDAGLTIEPVMSKDLGTGKFRILADMLNGYSPRPGIPRVGVLLNARLRRKEPRRDGALRKSDGSSVGLRQYARSRNAAVDGVIQWHGSGGGGEDKTFTAPTLNAEEIPARDRCRRQEYKIIPKDFPAKRDALSGALAPKDAGSPLRAPTTERERRSGLPA